MQSRCRYHCSFRLGQQLLFLYPHSKARSKSIWRIFFWHSSDWTEFSSRKRRLCDRFLETPREAHFSILGPFVKELPLIRETVMVIDIKAHFSSHPLHLADLI